MKNDDNLVHLSSAQIKLLNHYSFLYQQQYRELRDVYINKYKEDGFNLREARQLAKVDVLHDLIAIDGPIQIADGTWSCPICGLHIKDMGAHVKQIHGLQWDDFIQQYNWTGSKIYFSDTYRNNLRHNKLNYYNNTPEGLAARKLLSQKYSGENNPACRDDVKLKITKSKTGQHMSIKNKQNISKSATSGLYSDKAKSYGYTFWTLEDNKEIRFRSKCEYLIYLMFKHYDMSVRHEPYKIEYLDPSVQYTKHYIVDYVYKIGCLK